MGGQGSGRPTKEQSIVNSLVGKKKNHKVVPVAAQGAQPFIIPNLSGDHSAGHTGTPLNDLDIANKKYVDASIGSNHPHQDVTITAGPTFGGKIYADAVPIGLDILYSAVIGAHLDVGNDITCANLICAGTGHDGFSDALASEHFTEASISHDNIADVSADDHHAQSHTLASHSTKAHSELTGITTNQHHTPTKQKLFLHFGESGINPPDYMSMIDHIKSSATIGYVMLRSGSITGLSSHITILGMTQITIRAKINNVDKYANIHTTTGGQYATQAAGIDTFSAGDEIQVQITEIGGPSSLTNCVALVEIEYD